MAIAELLRRGFDVYLTLVDDLQIDCVIRQEVNGQPVYLDVQIKAQSLKANKRDAGAFAALEVRNPRRNFFFIFYSEQAGSYWVVPSLELVKEANRNKTGANKNKYRIVFTNHSQKTGGVSLPKIPSGRFWGLFGTPIHGLQPKSGSRGLRSSRQAAV